MTRAQPRTDLRCPACGNHFLAPPLPGASRDAADPPPSGVTVDGNGPHIAADSTGNTESAPSSGPEVVAVPSITFPEVEVHPPAAGIEDPPPRSEPDGSPEPSGTPVSPLPAPDPTPAGGGPYGLPPMPPVPRRRRRYGAAGW